MEGKINIGKVKPFVETFGFLKDLYELIEFAFKAFSKAGLPLTVIYWLTSKMSLGLEYVPSVIWVVGSVAFWLLLGWLIPFIEFARMGLGYLLEYLHQFLYEYLPRYTNPSYTGPPPIDPEMKKAAEEYYKAKQGFRLADKSAFKTFHWVPLFVSSILMVIGAHLEGKSSEPSVNKVILVLYCLFFFIFGLWYAFAYPFGPDTPYASLIITIGSLSMFWLAIYGVVLLVRLVRRLRPPLSSSEAPKQ